MKGAISLLEEIQQKVLDRPEFEWLGNNYERLLFSKSNNLLDLDFYGLATGNFFYEFTELICTPEISPYLASLNFRSPDKGANGTIGWDFTNLIESKEIFPNLVNFSVETFQPGWHNCPIVGYSLEEEGMIAKMISKMPNLQSLTVPSAPDSSFFEIEQPSLKNLCLDAGYDHQDFILNMSRSTCLPNLMTLDYCELFEQHFVDDNTPFENFIELCNSKAFSNIHKFVLRNPALSSEEREELDRLSKHLGFHLVLTSYGQTVNP